MHIMSQQFYLPAEWEPQSGVQIAWPHAATDWKPYLSEITETYIQLAQSILSYEDLIIVSPTLDNVLSTGLLSQSYSHRCTVCLCPSDDTWARDHGAITLVDGKGGFRFLDFQFNGWGKKFAAAKDNAITANLYRQGAFNGELADNNDFVLEGGSIESDGMGTIMTTSFCLLAPNRNQPKTKAEIEQELKCRLNAKRIIWLDHGKLIGDDTDGHIDTIVRFAPGYTLLYIGCDDKSDPQYEDFLLLENQLKSLRTLDGRPYHLIGLPMPRPIYDGDDRLPATYANFLVINNAVIVPTYKQPDLDNQAMALIGKAFPDRKIIGIDACTIIRQHGSIHCLTMQYPQNALRHVKDK